MRSCIWPGVRLALRKEEARRVLVMPLGSLPHVSVMLHGLIMSWARIGQEEEQNVGVRPSRPNTEILGIRVFIPTLSQQTSLEGLQCVRHSPAGWPMIRLTRGPRPQGTPGPDGDSDLLELPFLTQCDGSYEVAVQGSEKAWGAGLIQAGRGPRSDTSEWLAVVGGGDSGRVWSRELVIAFWGEQILGPQL